MSWQALSLVYQRCQYDELWRCLVKPTDMFLFPFLFSFIIITGFVTMVARRVPLLEQELPTLPEHLSSSPVLSCVRVVWSLVFCVVLCRSLFLIFPLSCCLYFFHLRLLITNLGIFKLFFKTDVIVFLETQIGERSKYCILCDFIKYTIYELLVCKEIILILNV